MAAEDRTRFSIAELVRRGYLYTLLVLVLGLVHLLFPALFFLLPDDLGFLLVFPEHRIDQISLFQCGYTLHPSVFRDFTQIVQRDRLISFSRHESSSIYFVRIGTGCPI